MLYIQKHPKLFILFCLHSLGCFPANSNNRLNDQYLTLFQVGFRKGGIQLFGPLGRRTQLEVVLAGLLLASLLALFGCAITLGVRYNRGNKHTEME